MQKRKKRTRFQNKLEGRLAQIRRGRAQDAEEKEKTLRRRPDKTT